MRCGSPGTPFTPTPKSCGEPARVLVGLPALLTGAACCVPTVLIALGHGAATVLVPVVAPLRMRFYPLSLVLLAIMLVWGTTQAAR
jgi:hypothetical protein